MQRAPGFVAIALALASPPLAGASEEAALPAQPQPPVGVEPASPEQPPPAAPAVPAAARAAAAERDVRFVATVGWDYGFEKLVEVEFSDGSTELIRANGGFVAAAGVAFLPLLDRRLETQATLGVKWDAIDASNGSITYLAFPLEILEAFRAPPFRLALGASLSLSPRLSGSGAASDVDIPMKSSLGFVGQAEWSRAFSGGRGRWVLGARFLWQRLQADAGGPAIDANAAGFLAGLVY